MCLLIRSCVTSFSVHFNQQADISFSDRDSFLINKVISTSVVNSDVAFELGDATYKSLISAGGEVEIKDFSLASEGSLILPDQELNYTCEADGMENSPSMTGQLSCTDHIEHPYHNPRIKDASFVSGEASEVTTSLQNFEELKDKSTTEDFADVTWKPLACEGGEVQISDVTTIQDETIPMPLPLFSPHLECSKLNTTNLSFLSQQHEEQHADHPYCCSGGDVPPSSSGNAVVFEEPARRLKDITFKFFNCTGGEIQISDITKPQDETVPVLAEQTSACTESSNYHPSISTTQQDVHSTSEHLDHPYCNIKLDPSPLNDTCVIQEALPDIINAAEDAACSSNFVLPDDQVKNEVCVKSASLKTSGIEIEEPDGVLLSQEGSALPRDEVLIFPALDYNSINSLNKKDENEEKYEKLSNKNSDSFNSNLSGLNKPLLPNESCKEPVPKSYNSPVLEKVAMLPSLQPRDRQIPAVSLTPAENQKHVSQEHVDKGPHQTSDAKDSAIGASGNAAGLCNSAEKPETEIICDVLKVLSECPSVASALQLGQLSPAMRRASLFLTEAKKAPPTDQFLIDDSALEADKSLLANVKVNPAGLWAEQLMSPMPHPLFNSTVVASKHQLSMVENVARNPCVAPQPEMLKPVAETPLIPDGPLQQQLRQMAEFLLLASGKINPVSASAPLPPPAVSAVQSNPVGSHSVCVGTSPMKFVEHSVNTSGQFEQRRDFSVVDTCTLTDPLLWK